MTRFWLLRLEQTTITHRLRKEPWSSTNLIKITGSSQGLASLPRENGRTGPEDYRRPQAGRPRASYTETWEDGNQAHLHNENGTKRPGPPRHEWHENLRGHPSPAPPAPRSLYSDGNQRQEALQAPNPKPRPKPSREKPPGDSDRQPGLQEGGSSLTSRISLLYEQKIRGGGGI